MRRNFQKKIKIDDWLRYGSTYASNDFCQIADNIDHF